MFAKSQPNLLDIINDDEPSADSTMTNGVGQMRSAHSISDLLAEEPQSLDGGVGVTTVKGARRKSALIAQWESRIQQDF